MNRSKPKNRTLRRPFPVLVLLGLLSPASEAWSGELIELPDTVIISRGDEYTARRLLSDFLRHTHRTEVMIDSSLTSRFDTKAYPRLVDLGFAAVPYLLEQVGAWQSVDVEVGSALISDPEVDSPAEVWTYNQARRERVRKRTLSPHLLDLVLKEILTGEAAMDSLRAGGSLRHTNAFRWIDWWQTHKDHFFFVTGNPPDIPPPEGVQHGPHMATEVENGLLDIHAVRATNRHIIQRAAAELGIDVFIGAHNYAEVITTVRMKGVTFAEFVILLERGFYEHGLQRTETGYRIGAETPAPPRLYIPFIRGALGMMMETTVFRQGEEISVMVGAHVDPPDFSPEVVAMLRVTAADGSIVAECPASPMPLGDRTRSHERSICSFCNLPSGAARFVLGPACALDPGEYSLSLIYQDRMTSAIAFEIYPDM